MPKAGIVPTCRYEHGELQRINDAKSEAFTLSYGYKSGAGAYVSQGDAGIVLDAYECPTCGYTELFERQET
jgi:hypothetical protein